MVHRKHSQWLAKLLMASSRMLSMRCDQSEWMNTAGATQAPGAGILRCPKYPQRVQVPVLCCVFEQAYISETWAEEGRLYINHMYGGYSTYASIPHCTTTYLPRGWSPVSKMWQNRPSILPPGTINDTLCFVQSGSHMVLRGSARKECFRTISSLWSHYHDAFFELTLNTAIALRPRLRVYIICMKRGWEKGYAINIIIRE